MSHRLSVPRYRSEIRRDPSPLAELKPASADRYRAGLFPFVVRWIQRHPRVAYALFLDSCEAAGTTPEAVMADMAAHEKRPAA